MRSSSFSFLFLTSLLTLNACNDWERGSGSYRVLVDPGFNPEQSTLVAFAAESWTAATNSTVTFMFVDDACAAVGDSIEILVASRTSLSHEEGCPDGETLLGVTTHEGISSDIRIAIDVPDDTFGLVALHEIGHALGLDHGPNGNVMATPVDAMSSSITCIDVTEFCKLWECDAQEMPPCQKN